MMNAHTEDSTMQGKIETIWIGEYPFVVNYDFDMEGFHIYSMVDKNGKEVRKYSNVWDIVMDNLAQIEAELAESL
jgi:hypothetical protein